MEKNRLEEKISNLKKEIIILKRDLVLVGSENTVRFIIDTIRVFERRIEQYEFKLWKIERESQ